MGKIKQYYILSRTAIPSRMIAVKFLSYKPHGGLRYEQYAYVTGPFSSKESVLGWLNKNNVKNSFRPEEYRI